ncbi:MAG TPA: uracil-DNA glycosylase [Patescibacteria group bacterium]|jgi:DNA polymerase
MDSAAELVKLQQTLEKNFDNLPLATKPEDLVHGEGDPSASVMFIGEGPGYYEARERRPFVGRSGKLLRKTLTEIGLLPEKVWISNIVKVRPPENRDPTPEEIAAFRSYLNQEIELINPEIIVTLGRFSMAKFLPEVKISQIHGRLHKVQWEGKLTYVLPMYHPAAALRSTQVTESFLADFQKIPKILTWLKEQQEVRKTKRKIEEALF